MQLVRNIVLGSMENPRSVMLTVIPANVNVVTQEILELANDIGQEGDTTLEYGPNLTSLTRAPSQRSSILSRAAQR